MSKKTSNYDPGFSSPKKPSVTKQADTDSASINGERLMSNLDILSTRTTRRKGRRRAECSLLVFELDEKNIRLMFGDQKELVLSNLFEMVKDGCKPLFLSKSKDVLKEIKREIEYGVCKLLKDYKGNKLKEYVMRIITSNITDKFQGDNSVYVGTLFTKEDMTYAPFSFGHVMTAETYFHGASPRPKKKKDIVDRWLEFTREDESLGIEVSESSISSENSDNEEKKTQEVQKNPKSKNKKTDNPAEPPKPTKDLSKPKKTSKPAATKDIESTTLKDREDEPEDIPEEKPKAPVRKVKLGRPPKVKPVEPSTAIVEEESKTKRRGRPPNKKKIKDQEDQTTSLSPLKTGAELDLDSAEPKDVETNETSKIQLANPPIVELEKNKSKKEIPKNKKAANIMDLSDEIEVDSPDTISANNEQNLSHKAQFEKQYTLIKSLSKKIGFTLSKSLDRLSANFHGDNIDHQASPDSKDSKQKIIKRKRNFEDDIFQAEAASKLANFKTMPVAATLTKETVQTQDKIKGIRIESRDSDSHPIQKKVKGPNTNPELEYRSPPNTPTIKELMPPKLEIKPEIIKPEPEENKPSGKTSEPKKKNQSTPVKAQQPTTQIQVESPVKPKKEKITPEPQPQPKTKTPTKEPQIKIKTPTKEPTQIIPEPKVEIKPDIIPEPEVKPQIHVEPVEIKPVSTAIQPETVEIKPEPVEIKPEPVEIKPEPVEIKPEPVEIKPEPVEFKPVMDIKPYVQPVEETKSEQFLELKSEMSTEIPPVKPIEDDTLILEYKASIPGERTQTILVHQSDLDNLGSEEPLNKMIMHFFLNYIHAELTDQSCRNMIHIFPSELIDHLREYQKDQSGFDKIYATLRRFTKDIDIFEKDYLILPSFNPANKQWSLYMICFPSYFQLKEIYSNQNPDEPNFSKPYMLYMDPVGDIDYDFAKIISTFLEHELKIKKTSCYETVIGQFNRISKNRMHQIIVPQQNKASDSGVFVLEYAETILTNLEQFLKDLNKNKSRIHMFPDLTMSAKRDDIKKLILGLMINKSAAIENYKTSRKTHLEFCRSQGGSQQGSNHKEDGAGKKGFLGNGNGLYSDADHGSEGVRHGYHNILNAQDDKVGKLRNGALA